MWLRPLAAVTAIALLAAGCSGDGGDSADGEGPIKFWTVYDTADRMAKMKPVLAEFTEQTGIEVELTGVSAPDLPQAMVSAAAAGDLPDVVVHGVEVARQVRVIHLGQPGFQRRLNLVERVVRVPPRAEAERAGVKVRLEDRFDHQQHGHLSDPVAHRRNP